MLETLLIRDICNFCWPGGSELEAENLQRLGQMRTGLPWALCAYVTSPAIPGMGMPRPPHPLSEPSQLSDTPRVKSFWECKGLLPHLAMEFAPRLVCLLKISRIPNHFWARTLLRTPVPWVTRVATTGARIESEHFPLYKYLIQSIAVCRLGGNRKNGSCPFGSPFNTTNKGGTLQKKHTHIVSYFTAHNYL